MSVDTERDKVQFTLERVQTWSWKTSEGDFFVRKGEKITKVTSKEHCQENSKNARGKAYLQIRQKL